MKRATLSQGRVLLVGQVATVFVGGSILVGMALYTSQVVDHNLREATSHADAALMARDIQTTVDGITILGLKDRLAAPVPSDPNYVPMSAGRMVSTKILANHAADRAEALHALIGSAATLQIVDEARIFSATLDAYLNNATNANYLVTVSHLVALRALSETEIPILTQSMQQENQDTLNAVLAARMATIVVTIVSILGVAGATLAVGQRLHRAARRAEAEEDSLRETTAVLLRRNDQFKALYQIVSDVNESLNLAYVAQTTIREARSLVSADLVGLRRLQGDQLVVAALAQDSDLDISGVGPVPLGSGLVGRVAKSGKTIRVDRGASARTCDGERVAGVESAVVVPLIVGAQVVGTLGCWSREPGHFSDDDEHMLEMMASQVATAIVSADAHEQSQRDALNDALTALPNRRQLNDDLRGVLREATNRGEPLAVAMVDIDNFKRFNDDYGHPVGDITLQRVATVLRSSVREEDRVYRFGGEEFLIVLAGVDAEAAMSLAERARSAVERARVSAEVGLDVGSVTVSLGVALFPDHARDMDALIDIADRAMYASKEMGRNRVTLASSERDAAAAA